VNGTYVQPLGSSESYRSEVLGYFAQKAGEYDRVDEQIYWQLSDALLWEFLTASMPRAEEPFAFLDAGGGTGRWTERILHAFPLSSGLLVDLSDAMLAQARQKFADDSPLSGRVRLQQGDLGDLNQALGDEQFDVIICLHNVAGFVPQFDRCLAGFYEHLRPGATIAVLTPNRYHVAWFNVLQRDFDAGLRALAQGLGRYTNDMPEMRLFTPSELELMAQETGLEAVEVLGFPALIYPGYQETRISGDSEVVSSTLRSHRDLDTILAIERVAAFAPDVAARGNNLLLTARRRS
jgi:ubiquinone/menaquinone biosynthesis C-methylase UbiE